jgi:kinesin family protein 6/9
MSKNAAIEIFMRVRPTKKKSEKFHMIKEDRKAMFTSLNQKKPGEYINNTKNEYSYYYNDIFGMDAKQEEVFEIVAKDVIDNAFEGFNGTIFAYGQTGSGKTFTMTGNPERYADRGIIPRTVSYIFSEVNRRTDHIFNISVSYLEIYNNDGYDLLSEDHTHKELSDLPKVVPLERGNGEFVLSGLSTHVARKEEDALHLLFIGDTNRLVCETPMNDASTRSHCIFILQIESRKADSDIKLVSKIHLVDLSGSERVGKTGVDGRLLKEACAINLSLHYLEQVINSLQKKMNAPDPEKYFVPYRNSLMTMVLRDSLGGNCKTKMISNIHVEEDYLDESISTCNFAMRVAMIKNTVTKNEAMDPNIIIQRLKRENQELKAEIMMLKGSSAKEELTNDDILQCQKIVKEYLQNRDPTQKIVLSDMMMIHQCFYELKLMMNSQSTGIKALDYPGSKKGLESSGVREVLVENTEKVKKLEDEILKLKMILKQRENEIMIFLNLMNKKGQGSLEAIEPERINKESSIRENHDNLRMTQEVKFPNYSKNAEDKNYSIVHTVVNDEGEYMEHRPEGKVQAEKKKP